MWWVEFFTYIVRLSADSATQPERDLKLGVRLQRLWNSLTGLDIRERLSQAPGRATPVAQEEAETEKDVGRDRVRERDDGSGWGL